MKSFFSSEELVLFRDCEEESFRRHRFGFGLWLRNTLLTETLWLTLFAEEGITQKDDMSVYMIQRFQQYLREKMNHKQ